MGFGDSKLATGTINLINDLTTWLIIASFGVGVVLCIIFLIRRGAADEMDRKIWDKRIVSSIIMVVGVVLVSSTLKIIMGYYT